tara:strand:- start:10678 stop:11031 length:354 start_codon:yes stop_codon:yes gene_type:complete
MQTNWVDWIRAVIVIVAALTILVSASAMLLKAAPHDLPAQVATVSAADGDFTDDGYARPAPDTDCHVAQNCMPIIMPDNHLALTPVNSVRALPQIMRNLPSQGKYQRFHPPRVLSQV